MFVKFCVCVIGVSTIALKRNLITPDFKPGTKYRDFRPGEASQLTFSNYCWKKQTGSFLLLHSLFSSLSCLPSAVPFSSERYSLLPRGLSQLANGAEKCEAFSCRDYFQRGEQALRALPGWCREAHCRAGCSGVLEADLYQRSAPKRCNEILQRRWS